MSQRISSYPLRGGATTLAFNPNTNRLLAAGQLNFCLLSIDENHKFQELHDFRNTPVQTSVPRWSILQPKDLAWNLNNGNHFVTTNSTAGSLYIWDVSRLCIIKQINLHQGIINRVVYHPGDFNVILTASQDSSAKLIDIRINDLDRLISTFRHSTNDPFRDIEFNPSITDKFAAVIQDHYSVPIWDIRRPNQIDSSVLTPEKVLSIAWNPYEHSWLATGGFGGHDRAINVWNTKTADNHRSALLFTVNTYGQVSKLSWHPNEKYQIACCNRTTDYRLHVWDVRRGYLPQISFCHHRNEIDDFLWQSNTGNIISIGRDEQLVHAPLASATRSEDIVSLFSLNARPNGRVHITMPRLDNDYARSQMVNRSSLSIKDVYSYRTLQTNIEWSTMIRGACLLGMTKNCCQDRSLEEFHYLAKKWICGNGKKDLELFGKICDINSHWAEEINRFDLSATWQMMKLLFIDAKNSSHPVKTSRSLTKSRFLSDSLNNSRRKLTVIVDKHEPILDEKPPKTNSTLEILDDIDSYIVREALSDDLIFLTSNDPLNYEQSDQDQVDFNAIHESMIDYRTATNDVIYIDDDDDLESEDEYENTAQTSIHSTTTDCCEQFFTINETYTPITQNHGINFDEIIRETLFYYIENNELQVAVHLFLVLCPQFELPKRLELFQGSHLHWIVMYIELLQKMRLFVKAKQVTKHCIEHADMSLNYDSRDYDGTILFQPQGSAFQRSPSSLTLNSNSNNKQNAPVLKEFICAICQIPCRGLFTFCGICLHGGHIDHMKNWFQTHDECPYGCGHRCTYFDNPNSRIRMTSQPT